MNLYEQVYNSVWIFFGVWLCIQSIRIKLWGASGPASGFIPLFCGLIIATAGLLLFASEWSKRSDKEAAKKFWSHPNAWKRIIIVLLGFCVFAYFMPILGFLLTSILVMPFVIYMLEPSKLFNVILTVIVSCFSIYFLFSFLLEVNLPKGFLGF